MLLGKVDAFANIYVLFCFGNEVSLITSFYRRIHGFKIPPPPPKKSKNVEKNSMHKEVMKNCLFEHLSTHFLFLFKYYFFLHAYTNSYDKFCQIKDSGFSAFSKIC